MNGKYAAVDSLCLAEFAAYYFKQYFVPEDERNDNQPDILTDETLESQHLQCYSELPLKIQLMTKKEIMRRRKVTNV